jgi:hypothetical protein
MPRQVTVHEAQAAAEVLGWNRTREIVGDGGLSGATMSALARLVQAATKLPQESARENTAGAVQEAPNAALLDAFIREYGYHACLESLKVLLRNQALPAARQAALRRDIAYIEAKFGAPVVRNVKLTPSTPRARSR